MINRLPTLAWSCLPDGRTEFLNQGWLDYTGLSLEEGLGCGWKSAIHADDRGKLMDTLLHHFASGEPGVEEARLQRFDGEYRWFLFSFARVHNTDGTVIKWSGTSTDIEELKRAESLLEIEKRTLEMIGQGESLTAIFEHICRTFDAQIPNALSSVLLTDPGGKRLRHVAGVKNPETDFLSALAGQLAIAVANALDHNAVVVSRDQLARDRVYLREEIDRPSMFEEIVGRSESLRHVLLQVEKVAPVDSTVLILGETGTGKELIARAIHKTSTRASGPFIRVNCAAIPASLVASELFGHEKGAFTGAQQRRLGRFELAEGGTIFLDEVGDLPMDTQIALLRVLQEREIERVGGNRLIPVDVRVLAATHIDMKAAVSAGTLREDLYYRLNVFPIHLPPLRERASDIPALVEYFIDRFAKKAAKKIRRIDKRTMDRLQAYKWPGNIREVQNVVERAVILSDDETFYVDEKSLTHRSPRVPRALDGPTPRLLRLDEDQERELIEAALAESEGRVGGQSGAACKLGVPRQTLESKITSLGINKYRFKLAKPSDFTQR